MHINACIFSTYSCIGIRVGSGKLHFKTKSPNNPPTSPCAYHSERPLRDSSQQSVRLIRPSPVSDVYYVTLVFMLLLIKMLIGNLFIRVHVTCFRSSDFGFRVWWLCHFSRVGWVCHRQSPHSNASDCQLRFRASYGNPVTWLVHHFEELDSWFVPLLLVRHHCFRAPVGSSITCLTC